MPGKGKEFKGIIFDLDGTLIDSVSSLITGYRYALKQVLGKTYRDEEIIPFFGPNERGVLRNISPSQWKECLKAYLDHEITNLHNHRVFPGIKSLLKSLKDSGIYLAIVTGRSKELATLVLEEVKLNLYFEIVETGGEQRSTKSKQIYKIVEGWEIDSKRVAYVGDSPGDVLAAIEAGVIPIWACWSKRLISKENVSDDVRKFTKVNEFRSWVTKSVV